jgi:hypothetical protein
MMEYVFFDAALSATFMEQAGDLGVECTLARDDMGITVALPENLPEAVEEALENLYDSLLEQQAALVEANETGLRHAAAIHITLSDGRPRLVRIEPGMMNRLLECLSIEELHQLVTGIAHDLENPADTSLCRMATG